MAKQVPARNGGTLTRPDKGETMNPNGRPKGVRSMKSIIQEFLECEFDAKNIPPEFQNLKIKGKTMTVQQLMTLAQIRKALKGDEKAYDRIIDRFEGKPTQTLDINHSNIKEVLEEQDKEEQIDV